MAHSAIAHARLTSENSGVYSGRRWIFFALNILGAVSASAVAPVLPPFDGSLSGDLLPFGSTKMGIHWTVTAATSRSSERNLSLELTGLGLKAKAEGVIAVATNSGNWRLTEAEVDVAQWFDTVAERYFPDLVGIQAAGKISADGAGTLTPAGIAGAMQLTLSGGSVAADAGQWTLSNIAGRLECPDFPAWTSSATQRLNVGELKVAELTLKNGWIDYEIESTRRIRVHGARMEAMGGTVSCDAFVIDATNAPIDLVVRLHRINLEELQSYLPKSVAEAHGRIDAEVRVRWSAEGGWEIGQGKLRLLAKESASIRLAPSPGFLTSQVPHRIQVLPAWTGWFGRRLSQPFPAYQTLEAIENGEQSLMVESIEAQLEPGDPEKDATVILHVVAHPTQTDRVKTVRLNIKVGGPLADMVRYGLNKQISFGL